ncbi:hypothetical protein [Hymenobacter ruricola]|uniref:Lipoprotein n=1 Tax=Hymenobacter ruricola TaxID=2791023 RepID=A0ABS0IBK5_9BACT|nr:hypothetical protein [Hymenobacter ruricola]MBF9224345.1 hypothetical protein [Hymenobacter ruricola]
MKPYLTLALAATLLAPACKKDNPEAGLPPATQEGKNTGGCLVNGERFVAAESGGSLLSNPTPALSGGFAFDSVYYVSLNGKYQGQRATILLFLRGEKIGTYMLNRTTQYYPQGDPIRMSSHATFTLSGSQGEVYVTNAQYTGQVVMTRADLRAGITAGTFEFTASSTFDPSKTITITKGRFDRQQ